MAATGPSAACSGLAAPTDPPDVLDCHGWTPQKFRWPGIHDCGTGSRTVSTVAPVPPRKTDPLGRWSVRVLHAGDRAPVGLAAVHLGIRRWQEEVGQITFDDIYDSQDDLNRINDVYLEPGGAFVVARDVGGAAIGFVGLRVHPHRVGQMSRMAVVPAWHRRGVATALVASLTAAADRAGLVEVFLDTGHGEQAEGLYRAAGFVNAAQQPWPGYLSMVRRHRDLRIGDQLVGLTPDSPPLCVR